VGPVADIDILVTDSGTDLKYIKGMRKAGVEVIVAELQELRKMPHKRTYTNKIG
jgi:hypothetical protein